MRDGGARWGAAALLVLAAAVRLLHLDADPPLAYGAAHLTDEGYYAKNAKELVASGRLAQGGDNHNHVWLAPLVVGLNALAFAVAGPSLSAARAVSAALGLVAVVLLAVLARRDGGGRAALAALAILAVEPALVAAARTALAEGALIAASALFALALARDLDGTRPPLAAVAAFFLALSVKASAVYLVTVGLLAFALDGLGRRELRAGAIRAAQFGLGAAAILAGWYLLYVRAVPGASFMFDYEFAVHLSRENPDVPRRGLAAPSPLAALAAALRSQHAAFGFVRDPLLAGLGALGLAFVAVEAARGRRPAAGDAVAAAWLAGAALFFSAAPYQPPRYFLILAAPAALLAAHLLADAGAGGGRLRAALGAARWPVAASIVALAAAPALRSARVAGGAGALGLAAAAALALVLCLRRGQTGLALAVLLAVPAATVGAWLSRPAASIRATTEALAEAIEPGSVVCGYFADTFTLPLAVRSVVIHGPWNPGPDAVARLGVTHLLVREEERQWLVDRDPGLTARLERLGEHAPQGGVRGTLVLWRVRPGTGP